VTKDEATDRVASYWMEKAQEALASARDEIDAGRLSFAVNRCYYSAFYAASAVLLTRGHRFSKHSGVRGAVHRHLVKTGSLSAKWGRFYDRLFQDRQQGDYIEFVSFERRDVLTTLEQARQLVETFQQMLQEESP
jgi:uncharacterized protein (UPF0332 family)